MKKKNKQISLSVTPCATKTVERKENPDSFYSKNPAWRFGKGDKNHWPLEEKALFSDIIPFLSSLETMTWGSILQQDRKKNHPIEVGQLNKCARDAINALSFNLEEVISLRVAATVRLYGFLEENAYYILWYDNKHGDNDICVCRSKKKHT